MKDLAKKLIGSLAAVTVLSAMLVAQTPGVGRYDASIEQKVTQRLADKKQFHDVQATVEDGIITLTGTVDLYQDKLDAAKRVQKTEHATGVRNLIEVAGPNVPDEQLQAKLSKKLAYDRIGYDNLFNYFTLAVNDGVVTVGGETLNTTGRDSALSLIQRMPGVKDVVDKITVSPTSIYDDDLRIRAARTLYRDPVLSRYAMDPQRPIRIIVDRGTIGLYGAVDSTMDKQIAGIRANQLFGAFRVENHLTVE
jgi:hyperosmotically inducible periplasmic protein